ncbi:N-acetyltransferase family protein [Primorskyibacter sp. S187A]|uniref:GNAT family N-acetyltransferase n=1 Tax=Primorskyibacter sp. S187A TaxID=3415130 RepID=UPI003C7E1202
MIVRQARVADAAAIAALINPVVRDTSITFTTEEKNPESLAQAIDAPGSSYHVVELHGQVVGYACYFPFRNGPGYAHTKEHSIVLAPEARGHGAGRALMAALEAHARGAGVHSLFAGVSGENPAGVAFHASIGFQEIGRLPQVGRKFDRWMDLILMQKFL